MPPPVCLSVGSGSAFGAYATGGNVWSVALFEGLVEALVGGSGARISGFLANTSISVAACIVGNTVGQMQNINEPCFTGPDYSSPAEAAVGMAFSGTLSAGAAGTKFAGSFGNQVAQRTSAGIPGTTASGSQNYWNKFWERMEKMWIQLNDKWNFRLYFLLGCIAICFLLYSIISLIDLTNEKRYTDTALLPLFTGMACLIFGLINFYTAYAFKFGRIDKVTVSSGLASIIKDNKKIISNGKIKLVRKINSDTEITNQEKTSILFICN